MFSVDISDSMPSLKLPYNKGEDPWSAAQAFIHKHSLPQAYLDEVAQFIIKNSNMTKSNLSTPSNSRYIFYFFCFNFYFVKISELFNLIQINFPT